jgi:hypothetical protein
MRNIFFACGMIAYRRMGRKRIDQSAHYTISSLFTIGYSEAVSCQHWKQIKVLNAIELYSG